PTTAAPTFRWPPVLVAALATFTVVTAEMMPVGILTPIAGALDIAPGIAGTSLSITGIVAAIVAAAAPVISGRLDK
ncbi:MFS transporter, partial [Burkholderia sp. SIMBA_024]